MGKKFGLLSTAAILTACAVGWVASQNCGGGPSLPPSFNNAGLTIKNGFRDSSNAENRPPVTSDIDMGTDIASLLSFEDSDLEVEDTIAPQVSLLEKLKDSSPSSYSLELPLRATPSGDQEYLVVTSEKVSVAWISSNSPQNIFDLFKFNASKNINTPKPKSYTVVEDHLSSSLALPEGFFYCHSRTNEFPDVVISTPSVEYHTHVSNFSEAIQEYFPNVNKFLQEKASRLNVHGGGTDNPGLTEEASGLNFSLFREGSYSAANGLGQNLVKDWKAGSLHVVFNSTVSSNLLAADPTLLCSDGRIESVTLKNHSRFDTTLVYSSGKEVKVYTVGLVTSSDWFAPGVFYPSRIFSPKATKKK